MQTKSVVLLVASASLSCLSGPARAVSVPGQGTWETTLQPRYFFHGSTPDGYYDTVLDITWLVGKFRPQGIYAWRVANELVASLDFGPGIDDWRMPEIRPVDGVAFDYRYSTDGSTDIGWNVSAPGTIYAGSTGSEMAHMYFNTLGNLAFVDISGNPCQLGCGLTNTGPFIEPLWFGWSQTAYAPITNVYWRSSGGYQSGQYSNDETCCHVWPVHDGDVGDTEPTIIPMPEPGTLVLLSLGLFGFGLTRRKLSAL